MNQNSFDQWLDEAAAELPEAIEPSRDLWPGIALAIEEPADKGVAAGSRLWPFVAGIAATLLLTTALSPLRERNKAAPVASEATAPITAPTEVEPVLLIQPQSAWVPEIRRTRNSLNPGFEEGLEALPPQTRETVERNLRQIHESLAEIHTALSADPGNLVLHRLLAATYQQEIELISTIGAMTPSEQGL
ncbi:MAG: hypothetical protein AAF610_01805 [Pseudomonadota bacterium]